VEADVEIEPETLNLASQGRWITAFIELPEDYHAADIDPESVMLNGVVPAEKSRIGDHDRDGVFDLMVKFDRQHTASLLGPGDAVEITVTGIVDGRLFAGADAIRVIRRGNGNGKGAGKGRGRGKHGPRDFTGTDFGPGETTVGSVSVSVYFYHLNHLGTPRAMTDENGNVAWKADYKPFGEAEVAGDAENRFRFPGQYLDGETGLHYNWHRYYDSGIGRYLTGDPMGLEGGINLYSYAADNPIVFLDIFGLAFKQK
jgi:RHS repeat-associated protein